VRQMKRDRERQKETERVREGQREAKRGKWSHREAEGATERQRERKTKSGNTEIQKLGLPPRTFWNLKIGPDLLRLDRRRLQS